MARSNILLIVAECQRWDSLNAFGNADLRRANLDALATHGVSFPQAIASALTPAAARATLLTGLYPHAHRAFGYRDPIAGATLPELLRGAGYHTAGIGVLPPCLLAASAGFEVVRPLAAEEGFATRGSSYAAWLREKGDEACQSPLEEKHHPVTWIGDHAVRFVQRAEDPFFLYVSFPSPSPDVAPPFPWDKLYDPETLALPQGWRGPIPPDDAARLREEGIEPDERTEQAFRRVLAAYYASLSHVDKQVGRLLATLTARGFTRNLIVYTAAQGAAMGQHGLCYGEGGPFHDSQVRVPLLVAGLAGQRRGMADPALAGTSDVAPTLLEEAGIPVSRSMHGKSLLSVLSRADMPLRKTAFAEGPNGCYVARTQRHRLTQAPAEAWNALYDLDKDPYEFDNRWSAPEAEGVRARLMDAIKRFAG